MFERRLYYHVDWAMFVAIAALCLLGLMQIYSISNTPDNPSRLWVTQSYGIGLGLLALIIALVIDYRTLADKSHWIYVGILALLVYVLFFGIVRNQARRWIEIMGFTLQPSEFAKAAVALVLAKFFGDNRRGAIAYPDMLIGAAITMIPIILIYHQPDLGTAVTLLPALVIVVFVAGIPLRVFGILALAAVLMAPVAWAFVLKDYQKERIETFVDPWKDPRRAGYQQIQARITAGSGEFWGKGFGRGTQARQGFLPEAQNDFIFSAYAEERGFAGVIVALGLYLFVILRSIEAARLAKDRLGAYLVLGVLACFMFQVIYNVAMSAGLLPVKGLTLPLMSSGGSSMIATLAGFGLILNVRMRRFTN